MDDPTTVDRRERLLDLLAPIHDQARATARRLCASDADGDDLFHEAALRALERLGELRDASRFRAWFYAVLLSIHRERHRKSFWRRLLPLDEVVTGGGEPVGEDGGAWEEERWRAARLRRALARLPPEQREAVVLFEVDGYSIEEVAAMQGATVAAVKTRLQRGRERLRRHYEDDERWAAEGELARGLGPAVRRGGEAS